MFTDEDEERLVRLAGDAEHDWNISYCVLALLAGDAEHDWNISYCVLALLRLDLDEARARIAVLEADLAMWKQS